MAPKKATRNFTVVGSSIGHEGGIYHSTSPSGAGAKAATQQFKKAKKGVTEVKIMIKETTQGSANRVYFYRAHRTKLSKPIERVVRFNGVETVIKNEYQTKLEKCNAWAHHEKK